MDFNQLFNDNISKMNKSFAELQENYNVALYNGVKYQEIDFVNTGSLDLLDTLAKSIGDFSKGNDRIVTAYINTVKAKMSDSAHTNIVRNKNKLFENAKKLQRQPLITTGYLYTFSSLNSIDLDTLYQLEHFNTLLQQLSSLSTGELIDNKNFDFMPGFDKPALMGRVLGLKNPIGESEFKKLLFTGFRDGATEPCILQYDTQGISASYEIYMGTLKNDLGMIQAIWNLMFKQCTLITGVINQHKARLERMFKNAPRNNATARTTIAFMDAVKKASINIDDILNIYARVLRNACMSLIARINQDQAVFTQVIEGGVV
ncbi:MAG: hypothetical protein ACRCXX_05835 [Cetobacterium sp.]|uniref:hypothetical protein n=1 Tax=Cetobacterium sp. TaxID=2071632 RepID=UPI003F3360FD